VSYPVTYYCPHCGAYAELDREGYLADRSVTPYPLAGWEYVPPTADYEADGVDGVVFTCGEEGTLADDDAEGCGERFYLSFVRFEDGEEVEPEPAYDPVEINVGPTRPRSPFER
jgi:hypothetical protein